MTDLIKRQFRREGANQLQVADITEHPTTEGKLYCSVVLDSYSRRVVGWAIDPDNVPISRPTRSAWPSGPAPTSPAN